MADDTVGGYSPIVSIRPERDRPERNDKKVYDPETRNGGHGATGGGSGGRSSGDEQGAQHEAISDNIDLLGIPAGEVTENVKAAIDKLLEEIVRLKSELASAQSHEAYLEEKIEHDQLLGVLSRHALVTRIKKSIQRVSEEGAQYFLVYLPVTNAAETGRRHGREAYEELMKTAAASLRNSLQPGEIAGTLENHDFAVILPGYSEDEARARAQTMAGAVSVEAAPWNGVFLAVETASGISEIHPDDGIDDIIGRARMRQKLPQP